MRGIACFVLLLAGCSAIPEQGIKSPEVQSESPALQTPAENTGVTADSRLGVCRKELNILKRLDNARYLSRKAVFDKLMSGEICSPAPATRWMRSSVTSWRNYVPISLRMS